MFPTWRLRSSAIDTAENRRVAVKKLSDPFQGVIHAKRCYRELKLLTHMAHENVTMTSSFLFIP